MSIVLFILHIVDIKTVPFLPVIFSGNIICLRVQENKWNNQNKDLEIIRNKNIKPFEPLIIKGQGNFFKNIELSLTNQDFTNKSSSQTKKDIWNFYANLILIHELREDDSVLRTNFITKNKNALKILQEQKKKISVPEKILSASSMIKPKYQNDIYKKVDIPILSLDFNYSSIVNVLEKLSEYYNWEEEEVGGNNPLYKPKDKIKYLIKNHLRVFKVFSMKELKAKKFMLDKYFKELIII